MDSTADTEVAEALRALGGAKVVLATAAFSALHGIRPMVETVPLDRAGEAYERMLSGAARFRMVLTP